jgi:hypothetical protein
MDSDRYTERHRRQRTNRKANRDAIRLIHASDVAAKEARRQAERDRQDYRQLKGVFDYLVKVDPLADEPPKGQFGKLTSPNTENRARQT